MRYFTRVCVISLLFSNATLAMPLYDMEAWTLITLDSALRTPLSEKLLLPIQKEILEASASLNSIFPESIEHTRIIAKFYELEPFATLGEDSALYDLRQYYFERGNEFVKRVKRAQHRLIRLRAINEAERERPIPNLKRLERVQLEMRYLTWVIEDYPRIYRQMADVTLQKMRNYALEESRIIAYIISPDSPPPPLVSCESLFGGI